MTAHESFTKDPPNATVSVFSTDGSKVRDAVVVLKTAKLEGDRLTFDVDVLEGDLTGGDGPAALFIDRFGFGGFHAGGFHAGGMGGFHAGGFRAGGFRGGFDRAGVGAASALSASGTIPTSLAAPGIGELPMQLLRSAALRSVRRRSVPRRRTHIRTAAITPTRLAIEATRMTRALLDHGPIELADPAEPAPYAAFGNSYGRSRDAGVDRSRAPARG